MADSYGEERGLSTGLQERAPSDRSVAELMKQLSDQTATLVRQELDLARAEMAEKGKKAGLGVGMFGGASVFGLYALGALVACAILALALAVQGWLAALIVAAVLGVIAGVLALMGKRNVKQGVPPTPERTIESVKEDVEWTKRSAQEGRR
jgi:uncharacterized membrane protein YqjE